MLLLSTSCLKWYWLHKIFKIASNLKFDGINLDISYWDFDSENPEYILELSKEFNIPVVSITAYERKLDNEQVDSLLKMATILSSKIINFYPPFRNDKDTEWFTSYLPKIKEKNKNIFFSIINVEPKTFLFIIPEYKDATLATIKKITWDTTLAISNVDIATWVDLIKTFSVLWNSIKNVFLWDKSWIKKDLMLWKWDMPLESLFSKLIKWGYNWFYTIKISPKELSAWNDEQLFKKLTEVKELFNKYKERAK